MTLDIRTSTAGEATVVSVAGEVDLYTAPQLREALTGCLDTGRHRLVIDLAHVQFLDSSGLGVLIGAANRLRSVGGTLALAAANERIARLLDLTGLAQVLPTATSVADALTSPA